jgi:hypothetical protein
MKNMLFSFIAALALSPVHSQNLQEWLQQKSTQLEYLADQLVAYAAYARVLESGYQEARQGLAAIHDQKEAEYVLHQAFFSSLKKVNPEISGLAEVADILTDYQLIGKNLRRLIGMQGLNAGERAYLGQLSDHLQTAATADLTQLLQLLSDGLFELRDNERIGRINGIREHMKDKLAFTQSLCNASGILSANRLMEQTESGYLKTLNP